MSDLFWQYNFQERISLNAFTGRVFCNPSSTENVCYAIAQKLMFMSLFGLVLAAGVPANAETIGFDSLSSLLEKHPAQTIPENEISFLPVYEKKLELLPDREPVLFRIPGFKTFGCGTCHKAEDIVQRSATRLRQVIARLETDWPQAKPVPLKQYIIQPYTDKLLQAGQMAHATFDTIRVFPSTVIIDEKVYDNNTHRHEALHLNQPFVGHVNELEAYSVNILDDVRFLFLNYPYFADVISAFFEPELDTILADWLGRDINDRFNIPREVQWYLLPFDEDRIKRLQAGTAQWKPLLREASRLYRTHPYKTAYLTAQTGVRSLLFDLSAVSLLPLPKLDLPPEQIAKAFAVFEQQMTRDDNTRLGYVIDRKQESLMTLKYTSPIKDKAVRRVLYFHFLKKRFFGEDGKVRLPIANQQDFEEFLKRKRATIGKMIDYPALTEIERAGAREFLKRINKEETLKGTKLKLSK